MSKPAKNEAALLKRAGEAIRKALIKPPGCTESTGCAVGPCHCAHLAAEAALAAIRKAGWAVVPQTELDDLRTENARLREAATEYVRAMEGFTESIRAATGRAYPWPAQEITLTKLLVALDSDRQKERMAKALSELAEMDADLLDIDPEKKP